MYDDYDDEGDDFMLDGEYVPTNVVDLLGKSRSKMGRNFHNWTPPPRFNPEPLRNPKRLFTTGGMDMYSMAVHNAACNSRNYGGIVEPDKYKEETSHLPSLALSMMDMLFWESTKEVPYHDEIDLDNATPEEVEKAMCSYLISVAKRKHAFRDIRHYASNNSACCVVGVGRIIASFRRRDLIPPDLSKKHGVYNPPGKPGEEGDVPQPLPPDVAKDEMRLFKEQADKANITKEIKESGDIMEAVKEAQDAMDSICGSNKEAGDAPGKHELDILDLIVDQGKDIKGFLDKVGDLMGHLGSATKKKKSYTGTTVPGFGSDFTEAQPHEIALLTTAFKHDSYYRASIGALGINEHVMRDHGNGPVYIAIDCSSSMHGDEMDFAKSLAAAAAIHCIREKRPVKIAAFNSYIHSELDLTPYPDQATKIRMALTLTAVLSATGGTSFEPVQQDSLKFCGKYRGRADVLMITDGFGNFRGKQKGDPRIFCVFTSSYGLDSIDQGWLDVCERTASVSCTRNKANIRLTINTLSRALDKS
jgi:hypothetical protein